MLSRYWTTSRTLAVCLLIAGNSGPDLRGDDTTRKSNTSTLKQATTVSGTILMPDGQTRAAGADVHLLRRSTNGVYTLPVKTQKTSTNVDGEFQFSGVEPGQYKLWAETPKLTTLTKRLGGARVEVRDGSPSVADPLRLHEGCNYRVKVLSADTGKPLPSGRVQFGWTDLPRQYHAGKEGVIEIGGLSLGDWYFIVTADGHETQFKKTPEQPLGSLTELEFRLQPGGEVVGVVQTDSGEPVAGARVSASSVGGGMTPAYGLTQSDKDGRFQFENLPLDIAVRISANKEEHVSAFQEVVIPAGQNQVNATILCNPRPYGGDCIVSVLDEQGQPIANAQLTNPGNSTADNRLAITDEKGSALLANMYSSHAGIRVFVRAKGFITQEISVARGTPENPSRETITMQRGKILRGQLLTPDDKPAPNVRVYYNRGESVWSLGGKVITDKEGKFEIDGLPEQSTLTVYSPPPMSPIRNLAVIAGREAPIVIRMTLEAVIRIRAVDKDSGKPIPEFNVRVSHSRERKNNEPRASISVSYSREGINILGHQTEFKMQYLAENTPVQVIVSAKGYKSETLPRVLAVRSDKAELLDVALEPGAYETVRGRIAFPNGRPVFGAKVKLIVGKVNPISERSRERAGPADKWPNYHWGGITSGQLRTSDLCLQFLSTATDVTGNFVFPEVSKDGVWIELFYLGGGTAPARYPDLRTTFANLFDNVNLTATPASSLTLFVDRQKWPTGHHVRLASPFYEHFPDCLERAFSSETQEINVVTNQIKFTGLPPGDYEVTVEEKATQDGNNRVRTKPLGSYFIQLPAAEDMEGDL
jgi:uncharacterized GH25 family protein/uncharacterized protein (DUF2141 family)